MDSLYRLVNREIEQHYKPSELTNIYRTQLAITECASLLIIYEKLPKTDHILSQKWVSISFKMFNPYNVSP